ncbi:hypothetical protein DFJ73DRAFT_885812 [Zopfochytrium polystomum]|nr:hypothetical protein DFJ73DRAFT_885812 [Zopfochytrium polystomum]
MHDPRPPPAPPPPPDPLQWLFHRDNFLLIREPASAAARAFFATTAKLALALVYGLLGATYTMGYFGSCANYLGWELYILTMLITTRAPGGRAGSKIAAVGRVLFGDASDLADQNRSGGTLSTRLRHVFPCIDWTLLESGTWGFTFVKTLLWTVPFTCVRFSVIVIDPPDQSSKLIDWSMYLIFGSVTVLNLVEIPSKGSFWPRLKASMWITFWNFCALELGRLVIGGAMAAALLDTTGQYGPYTSSLAACFLIPDSSRLRLALLRSLAPSAHKIPALKYPIVGDLRLQGPAWLTLEAPTESTDELEHAAKSLSSYALSIRQCCCTASRASLLLIVDVYTFGAAAAVARTGDGLAHENSLSFISPIPTFDGLVARTPVFPGSCEQSPRLLPAFLDSAYPVKGKTSSDIRTTAPGNLPFSSWSRLRLVAVSHYTAAITWILPANDPTITSGYPQTLVNRGWSELDKGIFQDGSIALRALCMLGFEAILGVVTAATVGRAGGVAYGSPASVSGKKRLWGSADHGWDPRDHLVSPADIALVTAFSLFVVGGIIVGIDLLF